jgi:hypothetical protein
LWSRFDHAKRNDAPVGHLNGGRDVLSGIDLGLTGTEIFVRSPLFDEDQQTGPRVFSDFGIEDRLLFILADILLALEITPERGADHVLLAHELTVVEVTRVNQISK